MGDLTKNLSRHEVACKCGCGFDTIDFVTATVAQGCADHFGAHIGVTSGCRCESYNEVVQKRSNPNYIPYSSDSQHLYGKALDFYLYYYKAGGNKKVLPPAVVYKYLNMLFPDLYGIGLYSTFVHFDPRKGCARW